MMNLLNYTPFWRGEGPQGGGFALGASEARRGSKLRGDEIRPTAKALI
jgi:hypothetical protein